MWYIESFMPKSKEEFEAVNEGIPLLQEKFPDDLKDIRFIKKEVFKNRNKTLQEEFYYFVLDHCKSS